MIIYHKKSNDFPPKVLLIPKNRSINHIYLPFSLSNMIYALLSKKCLESHFRTSMGQILSGLGGGEGGQTNFGNACILGTFGHETPHDLPNPVIFVVPI